MAASNTADSQEHVVENEETGYLGTRVWPTEEAVNNGVQFDTFGDVGRESLRELLPYVALGWAPEWISGAGFHCGARALARSINNMVAYHMPQVKIPKACTFQRLLKTMLSEEYKVWRTEVGESATFLRDTELPPEFAPADDWFTIDDLRYILEYYNRHNLAPMKFRLGVIRQPNSFVNKENQRTTQIITPQVYPALNEEDEPLSVLWLHNIGSEHWESIGPRPSYDGLYLFHYLGLHKAASDIIKRGRLYYVSREAAKAKGTSTVALQKNLQLLKLREYTFVYRHPSSEHLAHHYPEPYHEIPGYWFGLTPRSKIHDHWPKLNKDRPTQGPEEAWVLDEFPLKKQTCYPSLHERGDLGRCKPVWGRPRMTLYTYNTILNDDGPELYEAPLEETELFGEINTPYNPNWTPPLNFNERVKLRPPKTPRKRPAPERDDGEKKEEGSAKKTKTKHLETEPIVPWEPEPEPDKLDSGLKPSLKTPPAGALPNQDEQSSLHGPLYNPRSGCRVRMFRATEDSSLHTFGEEDALQYYANDLIVAIELLEERPTQPFWARSQDLREGIVNPGKDVRHLEELTVLPFGLANEDLVDCWPMCHNTYLSKGEEFLRRICINEYMGSRNMWIDDWVERIIRSRRNEGHPVAMWLGPEEADPKSKWEPNIRRYCRMANWNSKNFHSDNGDGTAEVWVENSSYGIRDARQNELEYKHDMNWGLRMRYAKNRDNLTIWDSKVGMVNRAPGGIYPKPLGTAKPKTLAQKWGKWFGFGPRAGFESKLTPQQLYDIELFQIRTHTSLRVWDHTTREVEAVYHQELRYVLVGGVFEVSMKFEKGERLFISVPCGPKPYRGWQGWTMDSKGSPLQQGYILSENIKEIPEEERKFAKVTDQYLKHYHAKLEQHRRIVAEKKRNQKRRPPGPSPLSVEVVPDAEVVSMAPGHWFAGGGKKMMRPDSITAFKDAYRREKRAHDRRSDMLSADDDQEGVREEKRLWQLYSPTTMLWGKKVLSEMGITLPEDAMHVPGPHAESITPWSLGGDSPLPTTNPVKLPTDGSLLRRPPTGRVYDKKDFRRMQTVFAKPSPAKSTTRPRSGSGGGGGGGGENGQKKGTPSPSAAFENLQLKSPEQKRDKHRHRGLHRSGAIRKTTKKTSPQRAKKRKMMGLNDDGTRG